MYHSYLIVEGRISVNVGSFRLAQKTVVRPETVQHIKVIFLELF